MSELYIEPEIALGVNGSNVFTPFGVGDPALVLYSSLIRGTSAENLEAMAYQVESLELLSLIAFFTRDILEGNGERDLFYILLRHIHRRWPEHAPRLLPLVPEYGAWFDAYRMFETSRCRTWTADPVSIKDALADQLADIYAAQLKKDATAEGRVSLAGKWAPREGKRHHWFAKLLMKKLRMNYKEYRRLISDLSAKCNVVEQKMCHDGSGAAHWKDIDFETVPSLAMAKYRSAFLHCKAGDDDRMEAHANFVQYVQKLQMRQTTAHGRLLYPHQFVQHARTVPFGSEEQIVLQAQWEDLVRSVRAKGVLKDTVVMADLSGSMMQPLAGHTTAMDVCLGLAMLLSEVNTNVFADQVMTFSSDPEWVDLKDRTNLYSKMYALQECEYGLSTNFEAALTLLLQSLEKYQVQPGEEPKQLIIITDMGWDSAVGCEWNETHLDILRQRYAEAGAWSVPRIVVWNVSSMYKEFHAPAVAPGVVQISGWSSNLVKQFMDGHDLVNIMSSPAESMRAVLYSDRYQPVLDALSP